MANTTTSPNMNLPVPTVSIDPGPDWANNVNASLNIIDGHNHSPGQGVQINPNGLNINTDLPFNGNNGITLRSVRFTAQVAPLATAADIGCLYESGVDLYYNDGAGNQVRITQGGSVTGSTGTITGLPSGTASASFSGGTFSFQSATNTPATINAGSYVFGQEVASGFGVTVAASGSQTSNYSLAWPAAAPTANQVLVSDGSGNFSWTRGLLPLGAVVATFPNLSGAYSTAATTIADANGFVLCGGQTISDSSSPMNGQVVPNINSTVFLCGNTTAGTSGGAASVTLSTGNLPGHTHAFTSSTSVATSTHTHNMAHTHQWGYSSGGSAPVYAFSNAANYNLATFDGTTPGSTTVLTNNVINTGTSGTFNGPLLPDADHYYSAGVAGSANSGTGSSAATGTPSATTTVSGTTNSTGSGTSFSILPTYITSVYLMRIK